LALDNLIVAATKSVHPRGRTVMATDTTIPVEVSFDAKVHIARLGLEREFEEMLEHVKQTVSGTRWIDVTLEDSPEEPGDLGVVISPHRPHPGGNDPAHRQWDSWVIETFPPEVCMHFCLLSFYEN
jgi:hypothetical protein